jgi:hypothetical protein
MLNKATQLNHAEMLLPSDGRTYSLTFVDGRYQAVTHWSNPAHYAPQSAALLLSAVKAHGAS